jgi:hypothetical protein
MDAMKNRQRFKKKSGNFRPFFGLNTEYDALKIPMKRARIKIM